VSQLYSLGHGSGARGPSAAPRWTKTSLTARADGGYLTGLFLDAGELAGCSHHPVALYVRAREDLTWLNFVRLRGVDRAASDGTGHRRHHLRAAAAGPGAQAVGRVATLLGLLNSFQVELEHMVMADMLFMFLLVVAAVLRLWRQQPSWWAVLLAGLLTGYAMTVWTGGLLMPFVLLGFLIAASQPRSHLAGFAMPVVAYSLWSHSRTGDYDLTDSGGFYLWGRVWSFVEYSRINPSADERMFCLSHPPSQREPPNDLVWMEPQLMAAPDPRPDTGHRPPACARGGPRCGPSATAAPARTRPRSRSTPRSPPLASCLRRRLAAIASSSRPAVRCAASLRGKPETVQQAGGAPQRARNAEQLGDQRGDSCQRPPVAFGAATMLFCLRLAWSRFRIVLRSQTSRRHRSGGRKLSHRILARIGPRQRGHLSLGHRGLGIRRSKS
jgi:hypothetical protein